MFIQEKKTVLHRLFCSFALVYTHYQKTTGTDKDNSRIDSRLLVFFWSENSLVLYLYIANYGKWIGCIRRGEGAKSRGTD
jgi:hypothetical protein